MSARVDAQMLPRCVIVTRRTPIELLMDRHGTLGQSRFFLQSRGESIEPLERIHERVRTAQQEIEACLDAEQRRVRVDRDELDRFVFEDRDFVIVVGQDGLVPNVAKYVSGQLVLGVNPDPEQYDGVLCRHTVRAAGAVLRALASNDRETSVLRVEDRVMARVQLDDGQILVALNEIFIGHQTHQSARYRLTAGSDSERQSSSGIIVSTGTGSTGWARSIAEQRRIGTDLPAPSENRLAWFVREPFPSVSTRTTLNQGELTPGHELTVVSEMSDGGTIFSDGIESDRIAFSRGQKARVDIAPRRLRLVVPSHC